MIHLVTGGSGSGKSEYGEGLILDIPDGERFYIATMESSGREAERRIARHRKLREGKGFFTIERPRDLGGLILPGEGRKNVLLECVSNLAANEMFGGGACGLTESAGEAGACGPAELAGETGPCGPAELAGETGLDRLMELARRIVSDIRSLARQADHLVIVTNQVGEDGCCYDRETRAYIALVGRVNQELAKLADQVTEVVFGIPVVVKGEGK